jgi:hypothetical protein
MPTRSSESTWSLYKRILWRTWRYARKDIPRRRALWLPVWLEGTKGIHIVTRIHSPGRRHASKTVLGIFARALYIGFGFYKHQRGVSCTCILLRFPSTIEHEETISETPKLIGSLEQLGPHLCEEPKHVSHPSALAGDLSGIILTILHQ